MNAKRYLNCENGTADDALVRFKNVPDHPWYSVLPYSQINGHWFSRQDMYTGKQQNSLCMICGITFQKQQNMHYRRLQAEERAKKATSSWYILASSTITKRVTKALQLLRKFTNRIACRLHSFLYRKFGWKFGIFNL